MKRTIIRNAGLGSLSLLGLTCSSPEKPQKIEINTQPNFLIFIADDVSWNDFGCYGNTEVQTPNIDALASAGLKFTNVYLTASSCSPSRNSIMTGRYPHNAGAAELHTSPPDNMAALPGVLKNNGYYTAQSGKFHMGKYIEDDFDVIYKNKMDIGDGGEKTWLKVVQERPMDKPFFFWFAALDAHRPWGENEFSGTHHPDSITPPFYMVNGEKTRIDFGKYYDEIKRFDYYIGKVIQELKQQNAFENTIIIVMADNGRAFPHSKTRVNDRGMKTPFILHYPAKITRAQVCNSLVSVIDIAPTFMSIAGADIPASFQGSSFEKLLDNPENDFRSYVFAEHNWHDYEAHERMVRTRDYMYILNSRPNKPQMGPADAVESPSCADLLAAKDAGILTAIQADVFIVPRANEELYSCILDSLQLINLASVPSKTEMLINLRNELQNWMNETGDNIPDSITKDWYLREAGYKTTPYKDIRGEMPGAANNAVNNNNKGRF